MVFVLVGGNSYSVTSTLADRDTVSWKYVYEQWVVLHLGVIVHSCDSDGCYRFINVFICLLLGFRFLFCVHA
jgi:hypothetical protein